MLTRYANIVLWRYGPDTSLERLERHVRWGLRLTKLFAATGVLTASSVVEGLLASDPARTLWFKLALAAGAVGVVLWLPATLAILVLRDIDREMRRRGIRSNAEATYGHIVGVGGVKMCAWVAAFLLILHFLIRG